MTTANEDRLHHHTVSYRANQTDAWAQCSEMMAPATDGPFVHSCAHLAREIKVELPGAGRMLNLAEVEVYGPSPSPSPSPI